MPCYSILFTDSEYITLFETPSILSELEPIKVRKLTGRMVENDIILHVANEKWTFFIVKVTIQRLNPAKLNRFIFSPTSKPSCCTPGPVASDLMIKAFSFDHAISTYQVASFHTI